MQPQIELRRFALPLSPGYPRANYLARYHCSVDNAITQTCSVEFVNLDLNFEQSARLELIAMHAGKSTSQMLIEAAQYLLDSDAGCSPQPHATDTQQFLSEEALEARFARILRHKSSACV
jgi:hypothetical protein